jgi:hypothetical protein
LFLNELSESFESIASAPQIGRLYRQSPVHPVRRVNHPEDTVDIEAAKLTGVHGRKKGGTQSVGRA